MVWVSHLCSKLISGAHMAMCFLLFGFFNIMNNSESQPGHWATERSFHALLCVKCCLHFSLSVGSGWKIPVIGSSGEKSLLKSRVVNMASFFLLAPLPFLTLKTVHTRAHSSRRWVGPTLTRGAPFRTAGFRLLWTQAESLLAPANQDFAEETYQQKKRD